MSKKHRSKSTFNGFKQTSNTPVPDDLFDELLEMLTGAELKVLLYIIRRTKGFGKDTDAISLSQFQHGIKTKDGKQLDKGCGVKDRQTIVNALESLETKKCIDSEKSKTASGDNAISIYRVLCCTKVVGKTNQGDENKDQEKPTRVVGNSNQGGWKNPKKVVGKTDPQQTVIQQTELQETVIQEDITDGDSANPNTLESSDSIPSFLSLQAENRELRALVEQLSSTVQTLTLLVQNQLAHVPNPTPSSTSTGSSPSTPTSVRDNTGTSPIDPSSCPNGMEDFKNVEPPSRTNDAVLPIAPTATRKRVSKNKKRDTEQTLQTTLPELTRQEPIISEKARAVWNIWLKMPWNKIEPKLTETAAKHCEDLSKVDLTEEILWQVINYARKNDKNGFYNGRAIQLGDIVREYPKWSNTQHTQANQSKVTVSSASAYTLDEIKALRRMTPEQRKDFNQKRQAGMHAVAASSSYVSSYA